MENNPYTPPAAEVADPPPVRLVRPRAVNVALALLTMVLVVKLLLWLRQLQEIDFHIDTPLTFAGSVFDFVTSAALIYLTAQGKRWARLLLLLVVLFPLFQACYMVGKLRILQEQSELLLSPEFLLKVVLPMAVNFVAIHLLFITGGSWFRERQPA